MRILYLVPDLFGPPSGIARYCRMVSRVLLESGCRVSLVSLLDEDSAQAAAKATFPRLNYQPCAGNRVTFVRRVMRAMRKRPDLILVGHPNFGPLGWILGKMCRAKVVNFIYGIDAWEPLSNPRRRALARGARIISISRFTARRCAEVNGIAPEKVRILHNCLDPQFEARDSAPETADSLSILTVARINLRESYKGHDIVIRALPALLQRFPALIYDIVGDGDGRAVLEQLAREIGVFESVRFHGVVSDAQLIARYHAASVFVMPSRFEGFGFVFLEAMTYGKPVVCGDEDASVEVVCDGETGFTVTATSPDAVGEALARLLSDETLRIRMGEAGKRRVETEFGFAKFAAQLATILAEVRPEKAQPQAK